MTCNKLLLGILSIGLWSRQIAAQEDPKVNNRTTPALNITAIDGINGSSVIQCWQLDPFAVSNTPGTVGALNINFGNTSNASYTIIPGRRNAGIHNAPTRQLVYFISGLIRVSVPNTTEEAWIVGGKYGIVYAGDTAETSRTGHLTEYMSDEATVAIQMPLAPGQKLKHTVLHSGGCAW